MATVQLSDTQLEYIEEGKGDLVVLVHGTLGDYRSWELQMNEFAGSYHTVSYSRRYHFPNQCNGNESDYSAVLHGDDLAELVTRLGFDSAHIAGTSYGAYVALLMAARHPEKVRSLVLGDPPVFSLIEDDPEGRGLKDRFMEKVWEPAGKMMQEGKKAEGIKRFVEGVVEKGAFDQFPPNVKDLIMDNACEFRVETSSPDFWTPFTCKDARGITTPTLLLTGDKSLRMFQLIVDRLEQCLPNNRSVRIPDTTHEVPADNPEAYNKIVLEFLEENSDRAQV